MKTYGQTFSGWLFVDIGYEDAVRLVTRLLVAGAGFACTSESAGRRIYFSSDTSAAIVKEFVNEERNGED